MEAIWRDLSYGLRVLGARPLFTFTALFAIALGVALSSVVFTIVNSVLLRPLPYQTPERLVTVLEGNSKSDHVLASPGDYLEWGRRTELFEEVAAIKHTNFQLIGGDSPEEVSGRTVSVNFLSTLGIKAAIGRIFLAEDGQPGANFVTLLSHDYWASHYGADPGVVGKTLATARKTYTVIGVLPAGFDGTFDSLSSRPQIWTPLVPTANEISRHGPGDLRVVARLKPKVSVVQAQVEMRAIAAQLANEYPKSNAGWSANVFPLHGEVVGGVRPALLILMAGVGFVLLIACANVTNMLLVRGIDREKEIAIRVALGAGRGRIIQQLLTESLLLSFAGGVLGLLLAGWGVRAVIPMIPPDTPRTGEIGIDGQVIAFTLAISFFTGIFFGVMPALRASKVDLMKSLKDLADRAVAGQRGRHLRAFLVVSQVALTLVLLIGAGLMINSFIRLYRVDPGFNVDNLLTMMVARTRPANEDDNQWRAFFDQVIVKIKSAPGVEGAAAANPLTLGGSTNLKTFSVEDRLPATSDEKLSAEYAVVSSEYFRVMGIRLLKGRSFTEGDRAGATPVTVINESMARRFWADAEPLGRRLILKGDPKSEEPLEIIGVVSDSRSSLNLSPAPLIYQPFLQSPWPAMYLVVRTSGDSASLAGEVRASVASVDKNQPVTEMATMGKIWSRYTVEPRFYLLLLSSFAAVAVALAIVGIYGVVSYSVTQRTREIGIRMAMGAGQYEVVKSFVGRAMRLTLIGLAAGLVAAFASTRVMESWLFEVSATDPATFVGISVALFLVALLASYLPARRASKMDPMIALRCE